MVYLTSVASLQLIVPLFQHLQGNFRIAGFITQIIADAAVSIDVVKMLLKSSWQKKRSHNEVFIVRPGQFPAIGPSRTKGYPFGSRRPVGSSSNLAIGILPLIMNLEQLRRVFHTRIAHRKSWYYSHGGIERQRGDSIRPLISQTSCLAFALLSAATPSI